MFHILYVVVNASTAQHSCRRQRTLLEDVGSHIINLVCCECTNDSHSDVGPRPLYSGPVDVYSVPARWATFRRVK